jgi:hypothetical protein
LIGEVVNARTILIGIIGRIPCLLIFAVPVLKDNLIINLLDETNYIGIYKTKGLKLLQEI